MIDPSSDSPPPLPQRPWIVRMLGPRPAENFGAQCGEVIRRTAWIVLCEILLLVALTQLGVPAGNAGAEEISQLMRRGRLTMIAIGVVLMPTLEEIVFRWLPSVLSDRVLRRKQGQRWRLGIPMAITFALMHNLAHDPGQSTIPLAFGFYFSTAMVPASQFLFGLLTWDLIRRYGLWASAFSHMLHNLFFFSFILVQPDVP